MDFIKEESHYLDFIEGTLNTAYIQLKNKIEEYDKKYMEAKRYLVEYKDELDSMEIFSNQRSIDQIENAGIITLEKCEKVRKLIESPYFARVDFQYPYEDESEKFYIGKFSYMDDNNQMLIYDWRAPISSIYYDYELGDAAFEAPIGEIKGVLTLKRQFKIKDAKIEYALETSLSIDDNILQRELSTNSDERMKSIIATIQKEQNRIIRNEKSDIMIIQGVAGSGKTSIALHRVAYMLYRNKNTLFANNIVIISPNEVFADYISNVLPELGEEPIKELSFERIAEEEMTGDFKYDSQVEEPDLIDKKLQERIRFKSTFGFVEQVNKYLEHVNDTYFAASNIVIDDFKVAKKFINTRYEAYSNVPVKMRIEEMSLEILDKVRAEKIRSDKQTFKGEIYRQLMSFFKVDTTMGLYQDFYSYIGKPDMFVFSGRNRLEWNDVFPYIYFKMYFDGTDLYDAVQHLVIDEMQDYTPIQYAVINKLFPCKKTILGDMGQSISLIDYSSLNEFKSSFNNAEVVTLKKSYRSTYEIIEFAKKIQPDQEIEPIIRHGEEPSIINCRSKEHEWDIIKEKIDEFNQSSFSTLAILCKTMSEAVQLAEVLKDIGNVSLLHLESTKFSTGIVITTIRMSKGLEFDEVIIPYANKKSYHKDYDRRLLYVACTRAMHKLSLTYSDELTKLIGDLE